MVKDPGLMTDSTGDGIYGNTDVKYSTQQAMKNTVYNGSGSCKDCGYQIQPQDALYTQLCPSCTKAKAMKQMKGRMV
jgi:predicted RNA-binding Zn-ribbon protein involved in translation (DUF1610 family)